jgi:hypothetical protein
MTGRAAARRAVRPEEQETAMTERYEKDISLADRGKMETGIYELGFDPESGKGFLMPFIVTGLIGGVVGAIILFWL